MCVYILFNNFWDAYNKSKIRNSGNDAIFIDIF